MPDIFADSSLTGTIRKMLVREHGRQICDEGIWQGLTLGVALLATEVASVRALQIAEGATDRAKEDVFH